jgi:hypothetical protein
MNDRKDKLLQAFNHMMDELYAAMDKAEKTLSPSIDELVKNSEQMTKKMYALTQDEIKSISESIKRDIAHAREYLEKDGKELNEWFKFDIKLVEDRFVDFLSQAADKSWLDFRAFKERQQNALYKTGEICTAGTLRCLDCGQEMTFHKNSRIPPCPKCHHTNFERVVS